MLDITPIQPDVIYVMDKVYVDFATFYNIHNTGAFFIIRAKVSLDCTVVGQNFNIDQTTGLRSDKTITLNGIMSKKLYPENLRLIEYYDDEKDTNLTFLSNNLEASTLEIAHLYRNRWQIEVFFKWIKQNLTIKKLWVHS